MEIWQQTNAKYTKRNCLAHMQFLAAKSPCTKLFSCMYSIPFATSSANPHKFGTVKLCQKVLEKKHTHKFVGMYQVSKNEEERMFLLPCSLIHIFSNLHSSSKATQHRACSHGVTLHTGIKCCDDQIFS